ncbi:uncharacterized protein LOC121725558 isoform X2 [Aricia agestis]|uniref:uncharacterized protein LOC121725558 isoform X2 n=1 Tax=Aricia agestis TaxID=91739 RepID=UPI001C208DCF|nr:uncharacterized protein LOC121725558 isoform X2 [Aricia agestis]
MKKVENEFKNKFHLLYSQESSQKIIWSSSDSSDYENVSHKENVEYRKHPPNTRKRKRRCRNKLKNVSNLDIVYAEDKQTSSTITTTKSPIIKINRQCSSPILSKPRKYVSRDIRQKSPIVSIPQTLNSQKSIRSPVLKSKTMSPIQSPSVRKKLFASKDRLLLHKGDQCDNSISLDTIKQSKSHIENSKPKNEKITSKNPDLVKRVKSYFENHFNSQGSSQNSISEYESTPLSYTKTSQEIDIISLTDDNEKSNSEMISSKDSSLDMDDTKTSKILKLKKDGLAYRLNSLLKKQTATISMWQNEKFLASNSKFSMPKGDFTVFRILNVQLKYGCYLLDAKDVDDHSFSIIINTLHVNNVNLEDNSLLRLHKPYDCITIDNCNIIVNVFKFECDNSYKLK